MNRSTLLLRPSPPSRRTSRSGMMGSCRNLLNRLPQHRCPPDDVGDVQTTVAEQQPGPISGAKIVGIQRGDLDPAPSRKLRNEQGVEIGAEFQVGVQPRFQPTESGKMRDRSERLREGVSFLGIPLSHPSNVTVQVPVGDEGGQHLLQRP